MALNSTTYLFPIFLLNPHCPLAFHLQPDNMNEEQADKAKRLAEEMFKSNDIEGAKRMVLEAQELCPSLPDLPQMLAAFNVHIAAAAKDARGHTNWYAVLDVDPSDDIEAIKKRYKILSLLTHPDKNRSSAAEGAFKLVAEAWETISSEKCSTGVSGSSSNSGAGDQHSSTSGAGSSSSSSSDQSEPKTAGSSSSRREPKGAGSFSDQSEPETAWSSSTQWDPNKSSSKAEVVCPKCRRNCKSLDSGTDLIIRCSSCNLFAVRGRQDGKIYLVFDEHGPGILELL